MIEVQRLTGGDWLLLKQLRIAALTDSPKAFLGTLESESARTDQDWEARATGGTWFVAIDSDGVPAGLATLVLDPETGLHYLESMWVQPLLRGQGIASAVLQTARDHAGHHGSPVLRLWILDGNHTAAAAYVSYGFQPTGRRQAVPNHPGIIEVEFQISASPLGSGGAQASLPE